MNEEYREAGTMNRYLALQRIIETGSFTKAARSMGCTQSSISQMISSLEDELSVVLLNRTRNGVTLTPEGKDLYPYIDAYIRQYRMMRERADEINNLEEGVVRVGTLASITCHWMPDLIRGFKARYPGVQFLFHQGDYTSIQEWIKTGEVDFGFISPDAASGLEVEVLRKGEMVAILPSDHPLADRDSLKLEEIVKDPYILLEEGHYSEPLEAFYAEGLEPNVKYRIHDDYAIMTMVEAGLGVSIIADLVLRRTGYNLARIPLDPPIHRIIGIGYRSGAALPVASRHFIEYLKQNLDGLP